MRAPDLIDELYDASYGRLVAQMLALCGSQDDAEDAVQEAAHHRRGRLLGLVGRGGHVALGERLRHQRGRRRGPAGAHLAHPDGSHGVRMLPMGVTEWSTQMLRSRVPGTMGAIEPGPVRLLHVSTDYGATWEVRVLPERWGTDTYVPDDWRSWTEDWPSWATP